HSRYEFNERSSVDVNLRYYRFAYEDLGYQGYQEFRNEDWFNRGVGARLNLGIGAAFGFVEPDVSASQTYEQALFRADYRVTGKLDLKSSLGIEWRQYSHGEGTDIYPVFSLAAAYQPLTRMTLTLEGHRWDQPAFFGEVNYSTIGFSLGAREQIL